MIQSPLKELRLKVPDQFPTISSSLLNSLGAPLGLTEIKQKDFFFAYCPHSSLFIKLQTYT